MINIENIDWCIIILFKTSNSHQSLKNRTKWDRQTRNKEIAARAKAADSQNVALHKTRSICATQLLHQFVLDSRELVKVQEVQTVSTLTTQ